MERDEFISYMRTIMFEEGYQTKKQRSIASSIMNQKRAINKIAQALKLQRLSLAEVRTLMSFG